MSDLLMQVDVGFLVSCLLVRRGDTGCKGSKLPRHSCSLLPLQEFEQMLLTLHFRVQQ